MNTEMKKRLLLTIIRSENCSNKQYVLSMNLLMSLDSELAKKEIYSHYQRTSAKLNIVPDFKVA